MFTAHSFDNYDDVVVLTGWFWPCNTGVKSTKAVSAVVLFTKKVSIISGERCPAFLPGPVIVCYRFLQVLNAFEAPKCL